MNYLGDNLLLKCATTRGFVLQKGLSAVEDKLPAPLLNILNAIKSLPEKIMSSETPEEVPGTQLIEPKAEDLIASTLATSENPTLAKELEKNSGINKVDKISNDEDLITAMEGHRDPKLKKKDKGFKDESHRSSNPFYEDDWKIPYGGSFTLLPPYIQI
jgi:hypothetical protein